MASYAGPAPWYQGVSEAYKNGRRKPRLVSGDQEWDMHGWHAKRKAGWYNRPSKRLGQTVKKRKVTAPDGTQVEMYKTEGYDDYIGFHNNGTDEKALDYALAAFNKKTQQGPIFEESTDEGHIKKVEYAEAQQVMRVTFWNKAVVFYFRVPTQLAGMLLSTARTNRVSYTDKRGIGRHALGRLFWELVRIKGQVRGSRYPFQYLKRGNYSFTGSNKQYRIKLTSDNYEMVNGFKFENKPGQPKPGETILSPIPLEEFERNKAIADMLPEIQNAQALLDSAKSSRSTEVQYEKEVKNKAGGPSDKVRTSKVAESFEDKWIADIDRDMGRGEEYEKAEQTIKEAQDRLQDETRLKYYESEIKSRKADYRERLLEKNKELNDAVVAQYKEVNPDWASVKHLDAAAWSLTGKSRHGVRGNVGEPRYLLDDDEWQEYNALKRKVNRVNLARNMFQRVWTKNELRNMDMRLQTATERRAYNAFISAEDWTGALEYLKGKSGVINIKNADGSVTRQAGKLAGASDVVE